MLVQLTLHVTVDIIESDLSHIFKHIVLYSINPATPGFTVIIFACLRDARIFPLFLLFLVISALLAKLSRQ